MEVKEDEKTIKMRSTLKTSQLPKGWKLTRLGDLSSFRTGPFGSSLHKSDYTLDGVPIINPMHIINGNIFPTSSMTVIPETADRLSEFRLHEGDVIIGRRGEMGRCAVINRAQVNWLCGTGSLIIRTSKYLEPTYLQLILTSFEAIKHIESNSVGSTMINLNQSVLSSLNIFIPPLAEQRAIATALTDVDALITSLDTLIAKKSDIKQATMQQLLTGKTRLPGFSGEWTEKKLGDIFQFLNTANNSRSELTDNGEIQYIHYGDIHMKWKSFLDCSTDILPLIRSNKVKNVPYLEDGDLIMADASEDCAGIGISVEVKSATATKTVAGLHTLLLRGNKNVLADGFKGYLQYIPSVKNSLQKAATGISVYGISKNNVKNVAVFLPNIVEQQGISAILSDMDAEIVALEQKRDKIRALKQGMMQELLTGKTRLL